MIAPTSGGDVAQTRMSRRNRRAMRTVWIAQAPKLATTWRMQLCKPLRKKQTYILAMMSAPLLQHRQRRHRSRSNLHTTVNLSMSSRFSLIRCLGSSSQCHIGNLCAFECPRCSMTRPVKIGYAAASRTAFRRKIRIYVGGNPCGAEFSEIFMFKVIIVYFLLTMAFFQVLWRQG